jgi:hypothetical protein
VTGLEAHARVWFARTEADKNPATPDTLSRGSKFAGQEVELGDGNRWQIPHALAHSDDASSPTNTLAGRWIMRNGEGYLTFADWQEAHRQLTLSARDLWAIFEAGRTEDFLIDWNLAVNAIGINYRLGPAEISALGLLDQGNVIPIAKAVMDHAGASRVLGKHLPSPPS